MKAAVYTRYGAPDVVSIEDVAKPTPNDNEVLIRLRATTVSAADWRARSLDIPRGFGLISRLVFGIRAPRRSILGTEGAGVIEAIGKTVTGFKVGDAVFIYPGLSMACHAEYKCMPVSGGIAHKPGNLSFEQAAALCFGGITALEFLRKAKIQAGERVLINGASGSVGSAAVQLAKHFGAHVTGVCSTANVALVKSIGADEVIDYTQTDFAQGSARYDVIMDAVGTAPWSRCRSVLKPKGRLLLVVADLPETLSAPWATLTSDKQVFAGPTGERAEDLRFLAQLAEAGHYTPVIDRVLPLSQIVEAHRLVESGRKKGNVVVTL